MPPTLHSNRSAFGLVLSLPLFLFLIVPVAMLFGRANPTAILAELAHRETQSAIVISLITSTIALAMTILLGTPLAFWLAHPSSRRSPSAQIIDALLDLPIVLPPAVAGVALLLTFGRSGLLGSLFEHFNIQVAFTPAAVVLAQVFVAAPYYVRSARAGFATVGIELREAAIIDGAAGWTMLRTMLVPLAARSLCAGAAMCWSRALGEFGATVIFAGNLPGVTQTMPLAVYLGFESSLDRALVLSMLLIALALAVLLTVRLLGGRSPLANLP